MKYPKHILLDFYCIKDHSVIKNNKIITTYSGFNYLFDINFLKKEFIYTKLKYSRCPQYDIVSGGVAALFAAFIGFLVSEKFGFELVDSGDFYFLFMYLVIIALIGSLFFKILNNTTTFFKFLSFGWFIKFYLDMITIFLKYCKIPVSKICFSFKKLIPYVWFLENIRQIYRTFWRIVKFLEYYPKNKY